MQKIIAVLNHFDQSDLVLGRAVRLAKEQNAPLEVLFVYETPLFSLPDFFIRLEAKEKETIDKAKIKQEIEERVRALGYNEAYAIFIFIDDTADRVAAHTHNETETLVVSAYQRTISEELAQTCRSPLLVLKGDQKEEKVISLPVELNDYTEKCIEVAQTLFPESSIRLIYDNHYLADKEDNEAQKEAFEKLKAKTGLEGDYIEEFVWNEADFGEDFDAMEKHLLDRIEKNDSDLTIFCSSDGEFLYSEGVSLSLLHKVSGDILIFRYLSRSY